MPRNQPLPLAVVRDLIGIARALYRAELAATVPDPHRLEALRQIGSELRRALDMGKFTPGSMGADAAWNWAEQATFKLGEIVSDMPVGPAVKATATRLLRR